MSNLRALWIDRTTAVKEGEPPSVFAQQCDIKYCRDDSALAETIAGQERAIDLVCFDFDYPDRAGLQLLRSTKSAHPSLPLVMLTVQHSEALAIWAFRTKVWDYLVKPIVKRDAERCLVALTRALEQRNQQPQRGLTTHPEKIPDEVAFLPKSEEHSLAPALWYIEQNFRSRVRSEDLAARCDLSPFRFSRLFKETFGITFRDYLISFRLREAYRLLENPRVTVADVSFAVGFNDPSYFARIFKQRVGIAPSLLIGHSSQESGPPPLEELPSIPL